MYTANEAYNDHVKAGDLFKEEIVERIKKHVEAGYTFIRWRVNDADSLAHTLSNWKVSLELAGFKVEVKDYFPYFTTVNICISWGEAVANYINNGALLQYTGDYTSTDAVNDLLTRDSGIENLLLKIKTDAGMSSTCTTFHAGDVIGQVTKLRELGYTVTAETADGHATVSWNKQEEADYVTEPSWLEKWWPNWLS